MLVLVVVGRAGDGGMACYSDNTKPAAFPFPPRENANVNHRNFHLRTVMAASHFSLPSEDEERVIGFLTFSGASEALHRRR